MADIEYKIVLLGDPGVGKTTWFLRIKQGEFVDTENHQTVSMGVEHLEHKITVQGKDGAAAKEVKVQACELISLRKVTSRCLNDIPIVPSPPSNFFSSPTLGLPS